MIEFQLDERSMGDLGSSFEPIIPVRIRGPKESADVCMLVDSGADITLLPYSVGEIIGLTFSPEQRREVQGIGEGAVPYVLQKVELEIGDISIPTRIGWVLIEEVPFVLGRLDIFQKFAVEFREFERKVIFRNADEQYS